MTDVLVAGGARRTIGGRSRQMAIIYYAVLLGLDIVALALISDALIPTLLGSVAVWGVASLALFPGTSNAGRGFFVAITAAFVVRNYPDLPLEARLWGALTLMLCLSVFVVLPLDKSRFYPFVNLYALVQAIFVYVTVLFAKTITLYQYRFDAAIRTRGLMLLALFNAILFGSALLTNWLARTRTRLPTIEQEPALRVRRVLVRCYSLILATMTFGIVASRFGLSQRLGSLMPLVQYMGYVGAVLMLVLWVRGQLAWPHKLFLATVAGYIVLTGLGTGLLYTGAAPGFLLLALLISYRRKVPWTGLLLAVMVLVVLNVSKTEYRTDKKAGLVEGSQIEQGLTYLDYARDSIPETTVDQLGESAYRFSNSDLLGYFSTWLPDRYPYYGNTLYTDLPVVLIPRVLYPEKQTFDPTNDIGHQYELLGSNDLITAVNLTLPTEAWLSGGALNLVVVAICVGMYLALLGLLFRSRRPAAIVTGTVVSLQVLASLESGITPLVLVLPFAGVLYLVARWAAVLEPPEAEEEGPARPRHHRHIGSEPTLGEPRAPLAGFAAPEGLAAPGSPGSPGSTASLGSLGSLEAPEAPEADLGVPDLLAGLSAPPPAAPAGPSAGPLDELDDGRGVAGPAEGGRPVGRSDEPAP